MIPIDILKIDVLMIFFFWSFNQKDDTKKPNKIINKGLIDWNQLAGTSKLRKSINLSVY